MCGAGCPRPTHPRLTAPLLPVPVPPLLTADDMQVWGWRIPFCLAFGTAILGFYMRKGLPEPKAFLNAARAEKEAETKTAMVDGEATLEMHSAPSSKR